MTLTIYPSKSQEIPLNLSQTYTYKQAGKVVQWFSSSLSVWRPHVLPVPVPTCTLGWLVAHALVWVWKFVSLFAGPTVYWCEQGVPHLHPKMLGRGSSTLAMTGNAWIHLQTNIQIQLSKINERTDGWEFDPVAPFSISYSFFTFHHLQ